MGVGAGVGMVVSGAILYWALEVDPPIFDGNALGVILMFFGLAVLVTAFTVYADGLPSGAGAGTGMLVVGTVLYWAFEVDLPFVLDGALAVILMAVGLLAIVVAVVMDQQRARARHTVENRFWRAPRTQYYDHERGDRY